MVWIGKIRQWDTKKELLIFLRNQNVLSLAQRGVATNVESFNGAPPQVIFDLSVGAGLKNVRSITVSGAPLSEYDDYTVDYEGTNPGRITFTVAPAGGVNNVVITFDSGDGDSIYPDFPRTDISIESYPRISIDIVDITTNPFGVGNTHKISNIRVTVHILSTSLKEVEEITEAVRNAFLDNATTFWHFQYITPSSTSELQIPEFRKFEVEKRVLLLDIVLQAEQI